MSEPAEKYQPATSGWRGGSVELNTFAKRKHVYEKRMQQQRERQKENANENQS